jgi:TPP-dependent pyruvate/acetoin dehydrogenase alpha subunit
MPRCKSVTYNVHSEWFHRKFGNRKQWPMSAGTATAPGLKSTMSSVLNASKLKSLYAALLKCRLASDQILLTARDRPAGPRLREEAVLVGAAMQLKPGDCIVPSPQAPLAELVRGKSSLKTFVSAQAPTATIHNPQLQIGMATGLALALKEQRRSHVTLALGKIDLLLESGWAEALNFAAGHKLPLVFVIAHATARNLRNQQRNNLVPAITVDGSDVVAVYRVMQESMRRARQGHGPTVIEARIGGADPLAFMENYLRTRNLWSNVWKNRVGGEFKRELQEFCS